MNETSYAELKKFKDQYGVDYSIGDLTPTICEINNWEIPAQSGGTPIAVVVDHAQRLFDGEGKNEKTFIYCPDAVGEIHRQHYPDFLARVEKVAGIRLLSSGVMPSVTPVCFGTIFSGASPEVHGIRQYAKPVLEVETLFDSAVKAGKKVAIVAVNSCSIDMIFRKRKVDYYSLCTDARCREITEKIMRSDDYDMIISYSTDYDHYSHKTGCDSETSVTALKTCVEYFEDYARLTDELWGKYNRTLVWAPDHGNHPVSESSGTHGTNTADDMLVNHFYRITAGNK
jgi:hypothetical protein